MNQTYLGGVRGESFGKVLSPVRLQRFLPVLGRVSVRSSLDRVCLCGPRARCYECGKMTDCHTWPRAHTTASGARLSSARS